MNKLIAALALTALLSGCTFCRTHELACAVAGAVAINSLALTMHGGHSTSSGPAPVEPVPGVQPVVCTSAGNCK